MKMFFGKKWTPAVRRPGRSVWSLVRPYVPAVRTTRSSKRIHRLTRMQPFDKGSLPNQRTRFLRLALTGPKRARVTVTPHNEPQQSLRRPKRPSEQASEEEDRRATTHR
jgi:hypothetical protein